MTDRLVETLIGEDCEFALMMGMELEDCVAAGRGVEGRVWGRRRALLRAEAVLESMGTQTRE